MPKHSHPDIPIRFRRAARRAVFFKWLARLTLPPLAVAVVISLIMVRRYFRPRPGGPSAVKGTSGALPFQKRGLTFTLKNKGIDLGPLKMAMGKITVTQSIAGLRRREIDRVDIPHMVAALNFRAGSNQSFSDQLRTMTGENPLDITDLVVKTGTLVVTPPGSSAIQVPFTLTAAHQGNRLYHFEGQLSPGSYPIRVSGELNPATGNGKLTASATALELNQWVGYLLHQENVHWTIGELAAKTDLQISLIFKNYSLIWGHVDIETAGIDTRLDPPAAANTSDRLNSTQAMVHSAHITADTIATDKHPGRLDLHYTLDLKQGQWRREKDPVTCQCDNLSLKGTVRFPPGKPPIHALSGTITGLKWQGENAGFSTSEMRVTVPAFTNSDALRWSGTATAVVGEWRGLSLAAPNVTVTGSLIDLKLTAPALTAKRDDFTAQCEPFEGRFSADTYLGTLGKGVLSSVTRNQRAYLNTATPFSFRKDKTGGITVAIPALKTPLLPDSSLTAVTVAARDKAVTIHGAGTFAPSLLNQTTWMPKILHGAPLSATFKLVQTDTAFFAMTIPEQDWTLTGDTWQLATSIQGTITAANKPGGTLKCDLKTTDVKFKNKTCEISAPNLDLSPVKWRWPGKNETPLANFLTRPAEGTITGSITTKTSKIRFPSYQARDISMHFPFTWQGQAGFVAPDTSGQPSPTIQVKTFTAGKADISLHDLSLIPDKRSITLKTALAGPDESVKGALESTITLDREPAALFRLRLACPNLATVTWLNHLPLPMPEQTTYAGGISCEASFFMDGVGTAGTGALQLNDVSIKNGRAFTAAGINASLRFQELFPLTTPPGQTLTLDRLQVGNISLGPSQFRFQLPGSSSIYVERATAGWCGGFLQTQSVILSPKTNSLILDITAKNLQLDQVLTVFPYLDAKATGRFNARLPLRLENGRLNAQNWLFSSVSPGRLKLRGPAAFLRSLGEKPPYDKHRLAAFSDLTYADWKLTITSAPSPALQFMIKGATPGRRRPKPFTYARQRSLPTGDLLKAVPAIFAEPAETQSSEPESPE